MMPYILSTNYLCIGDDLFEVTIEDLGLNTYIIMKYNITTGKRLTTLMNASENEKTFHLHKLTEKEIVIVFKIPKNCMLAINMIRDNTFDCMSSYMIAKNARFWSFCCYNIFNEKSLAARESSQAFIIFNY